ncbi:MAG: protein kinase [Acidobacteriia bacterium]|nr:protein kinase [Terriglobia bacterium]
MPGIGRSENLVRFEGFELDLRTGELRKDGDKTVRLSEQPLRVLVALLERPGDLVLREDLRKRLWPNDTIVEFEHSIGSAVNRLRQALGDSAENPRFIETLARRGYRWKPPLEWVEATPESSNLSAPTLGQNLLGKRVAHYRVLEVLGGGGMGVVYKAEDIKLGRRVALKFLPEELAGNAAAMQRFEREARAASALNHPNICTIHAVEEHDGQPFIVMELLEGHTLRDILSQEADSKSASPFRLEPLLDTALQIAHGLEAAHTKGIIHRDIKPANIFITNHGQAKILDFGLAKLHEFESVKPPPQSSAEPRPKHGSNPLLTLTRTGATVGTAAYMSPEQVRGEKLDPRTDLFSFGLVLYEMATKQRAFPGDTAPVLHDAILNQAPVPVRELNGQIPAKLENIVSRALEKDREARYQTATEMRTDLEDLQRQLSPKRLPRRWAMGLGIAAAILIATFIIVLMKKPKTVSVVPEIKVRQLTINSSENPVAGGAISPDGKYLAYIDPRGLHINSINTGESRTVPQPGGLKDQRMKQVAVWFPDSARFLVNAYPSAAEWNEWSSVNGSIWTVSVLGGAPTKLRDHAIAWSVSPDGSLVSFGTNKGKLGEREIWLMRPNGEQARKFQETSEDTSISNMGWSPDGKRYSYIFADASGESMLSRDITGSPAVTLFQSSELKKTNDIVRLHDGRLVYDMTESGSQGTVCNYWITRLDLSSGKRLEAPRRLTNWPNFCVTSGSVTSDDKRLVYSLSSSGFYTSYVADLEAGGTRIRNAKHFTLEDSDDGAHGWTADGKVIVAQIRGSGWGLYKQSLDSDTPEPIASSADGGALLLGATSPDGKWYVARSWPDKESVEHPSVPLPIVRIPLAGGAPETILLVSRHANVSCARPPSSICVIAMQSEDRKQMVVSILDPVKGRGYELARFDFARELAVLEVPTCVISPDGTRLAIARSPESPIEIRSLHGQLVQTIPSQSAGELLMVFWTADQKGFFVTRKAQNGNELLYLDLRGNVTSLRKCIGGETCFGVPSPDGRHLAIIDRNQSANIWMMENF